MPSKSLVLHTFHDTILIQSSSGVIRTKPVFKTYTFIVSFLYHFSPCNAHICCQISISHITAYTCQIKSSLGNILQLRNVRNSLNLLHLNLSMTIAPARPYARVHNLICYRQRLSERENAGIKMYEFC